MSAVDRLRPVLDRFGLMFKADSRRGGAIFAEEAVDRWLSLFTSLTDPDEVLKKAGISRASLRALEGDDEISTAMDTRREALLALPWRLEPEGSPKDVPEPVQWLWDELEKHAEDILGACMEALPYGYSVHQAIYKMDDATRRVTWNAVVEESFEYFIPQRDGKVLFRSMKSPQGEPTDARKIFLTVRGRKKRRNPYGEALYSRLYWPWFFRSQGWRFWGRWLERFGTPLLIGKTAGDAAQMAEQLALVVQSATIAVGNGDSVEIAENKGGSGHFEGFERACCSRIQKMILGQTLTTDSGGTSGRSGSYALGQIHNEVRKDRRDADVRMVRRTVQMMVDTLWGLNGFAGMAPTFVLADDTGLEAARAERDATLANAKIARFNKSYLLRVYDFEEGDIEVPDPDAEPAPEPFGRAPGSTGNMPPIPAKGDAKKAALAALFSAKPRFTPEQQVIERGIDEVLGDLGEVIGSAEIKAAIRVATSPEDLAEHLSRLLADADAPEFQRVMERALFAADIIGYAHASKQ